MGDIRIAGVWRTTAAAGDVWSVIADLSTWPEWWPAIREVELLAGVDHEPDAARLTFDTPAPLRPLVVTLEVTDRDPPNRLVVTPTGGPLAGAGRLDVAEADEGSEVAYDLRLRVRSLLLRPLESVLAGATRSSGRARLRQAGDDLARLAGGEPGRHEP